MWASVDFRLIGLGNFVLKLDGYLVGVMNLILGYQKRVEILETVFNSRLVGGIYVILEKGLRFKECYIYLLDMYGRQYMQLILFYFVIVFICMYIIYLKKLNYIKGRERERSKIYFILLLFLKVFIYQYFLFVYLLCLYLL